MRDGCLEFFGTKVGSILSGEYAYEIVETIDRTLTYYCDSESSELLARLSKFFGCADLSCW